MYKKESPACSFLPPEICSSNGGPGFFTSSLSGLWNPRFSFSKSAPKFFSSSSDLSPEIDVYLI